MRTTRKRGSSAQSWGYHLIVNAGNCDPVALRSKATISAFAKELVQKIDMIGFGPPRVVMFGTGSKKGYTLVQLIETSCISAHFVEEFNDIYLDIFSCKPFKTDDAMAVFRSYFKPGRVDTTFLKRQARH
jgi:S-adenosylmethionine/arginine decarboxylase-like enzyme